MCISKEEVGYADLFPVDIDITETEYSPEVLQDMAKILLAITSPYGTRFKISRSRLSHCKPDTLEIKRTDLYIMGETRLTVYLHTKSLYSGKASGTWAFEVSRNSRKGIYIETGDREEDELFKTLLKYCPIPESKYTYSRYEEFSSSSYEISFDTLYYLNTFKDYEFWSGLDIKSCNFIKSVGKEDIDISAYTALADEILMGGMDCE